MTDMLEQPIFRYDVTFEAISVEQGHSIVRLVLSREGAASAPATTFFFEPKEEMTPEATRLLARFLNQYITRFAFVPPKRACAGQDVRLGVATAPMRRGA
jgi:hypothetical protein